MTLVDSSVWVDYFNGKTTAQTNILDTLLERELVLIGDLIYIEVLQGFRIEKDFNLAQQLVDALVFKEMVGKEVAFQSIHNYRLLRKKGVTVRKTIDVIIGTFCIVNSLELLHSDNDFDPMEKYLGLKITK